MPAETPTRGDMVEVVDASPAKGGKKMPFAKGQALQFAEAGPVGWRFKGILGWFKPERFEVRRG